MRTLLIHGLMAIFAVTFIFDHEGGPELAGFTAEKSITTGCTGWTTLKEIAPTLRTFTDETQTTKGTACYRVLAYGSAEGGERVYSAPSNIIKVTYTNQATLLRVQSLQQTLQKKP